MKQTTKQIFIVIVVIVAAFIGFQMFFVTDTASDVSLVADELNPVYIIDGPEILAQLNRLNQVDLDGSVFSNKIFTSLVSFERPIADQVSGRSNPFLPIGVNGATTLPRGTSTLPVR